MSWFDRFAARRARPDPSEPGAAATAPAARLHLPLFPLKSVLFPGGVLSLKIFEQRYLDMTAGCMKRTTPFGVCLIAEGEEVGAAAAPHAVGTLATITGWDMQAAGVLLLEVRGSRRFRLAGALAVGADQLLQATVELLPEAPPIPIPAAFGSLVPVLRQIAADLGAARMPAPHAWDDAAWVGCRLAEVMPVQALAKQKLLELEDPVMRLEILFRFLAQRGLVQ